MAKEIEFIDTIGLPKEYHPKPATQYIPDWYKQTKSYINDEKKVNPQTADTPHTIKKCIPVFDAMTAGYIIVTPCDVQVEKQLENDKYMFYFTWPLHDAISFHPVEQAPLHPAKNGFSYPKWNNPFGIKTSAGYSTLFLPPMHNPNNIFTILPGLVDTDKYNNPINFPFVLNDLTWTGIIPAGTPIAQIIPIKRDFWNSNVTTKIDNAMKEQFFKLRSIFFNSYKKQFWESKQYK